MGEFLTIPQPNHTEGPLATLHSFSSLCLSVTLPEGGGSMVLVVGAWRLSIYFPQAVARQCFLLSASKIFSLPQRAEAEKEKKNKKTKCEAGRKKAVDREQSPPSIRPSVRVSFSCPWAILQHLPAVCCQPGEFHLFFPHSIVFAFNCGIKNTPEYVGVQPGPSRDTDADADLYLWPVRLCRQSISFLACFCPPHH